MWSGVTVMVMENGEETSMFPNVGLCTLSKEKNHCNYNDNDGNDNVGHTSSTDSVGDIFGG